MNARAQAAFTLVETLVALAVAVIAAGGALFALASFGKYVAQQNPPARAAAVTLARQTLRIAQDAWKYGSPGTAPAGTQTVNLPIGAATGAPAAVTTAISMNGPSAAVTVTVRYAPDPARGDSGVVIMRGEVLAKSPLPGSQVSRPGLVPLPANAP